MKTLHYLKLFLAFNLIFALNIKAQESEANEDPRQRDLHEFEITKDPVLGYPPSERLQVVRDIIGRPQQNRTPSQPWQERGPSDVGGRTRAIMFDPGDAGNGYKKVWAGGVAGGLWHCD